MQHVPKVLLVFAVIPHVSVVVTEGVIYLQAVSAALDGQELAVI